MRQRKPTVSWHTFRAVEGEAELLLVAGKGRPYLWAGAAGKDVYAFSGDKALRTLARAILRNTKP
jgi:hypothetical protein